MQRRLSGCLSVSLSDCFEHFSPSCSQIFVCLTKQMRRASHFLFCLFCGVCSCCVRTQLTVGSEHWGSMCRVEVQMVVTVKVDRWVSFTDRFVCSSRKQRLFNVELQTDILSPSKYCDFRAKYQKSALKPLTVISHPTPVHQLPSQIFPLGSIYKTGNA